MVQRTFAPGFRLSTRDVVALAVGAAAAIAFAPVDRWVSVAIAFVVAHFFLFCNVLRIPRAPGLIWAAAFIALATAASALRMISWPLAIACAAGLTIGLALIETRRPSYHGIGWRTLNPALPEWWDAQRDALQTKSS